MKSSFKLSPARLIMSILAVGLALALVLSLYLSGETFTALTIGYTILTLATIPFLLLGQRWAIVTLITLAAFPLLFVLREWIGLLVVDSKSAFASAPVFLVTNLPNFVIPVFGLVRFRAIHLGE